MPSSPSTVKLTTRVSDAATRPLSRERIRIDDLSFSTRMVVSVGFHRRLARTDEDHDQGEDGKGEHHPELRPERIRGRVVGAEISAEVQFLDEARWHEHDQKA